MKRVLSLVLALVLVLGMMPTFAASATGADQLKAYGFVSGGTDGDLMVDKTLTRGELAVVLSELYGVKDQAANTVFPANFTDVNNHWAKPYVAYAQEMGWLTGFPDGTFKPDDAVSSQQLAATLVKALGYDVAWGDVDTTAATLGINVGSDATLTRGEAFESIWTAVNTPKQGSEVSLGVELGKLEADTPAAGDLAVEKVYSDNLKQIKVEFNQPVDEDSAIEEENYTIKKNDKTVDSDDYTAELDADGQTVVITLDTAADQQDDFTITAEDIDNAAGTKTVVKSTKEIELVDTNLPEVLAVEVAGSSTIKVTFSEPVDTTGTKLTDYKKAFEVNDGKYYVKKVDTQKNDTELLVELYTTLKEGDLPFKMNSDVVDYAGFSVIGSTRNLTVVEDVTAPVVTGFKSADEQEVVLVWSEDIELASHDYDDFYHTNGSNPVAFVDKNGNKLTSVPDSAVDGNELTLTFDADHKLAPGTTYVYVLKDAVKDLWNNKNSQQMTSVEVTRDTTNPEFTKVEYTDTDTVEVTFSEKVDLSTISNDGIALLDKDGDAVSISPKYTKSGSSKTFTILFRSADLDGDYTLVLEDVEDVAGNEMAKTSLPFTALDKDAPTAKTPATIYTKTDEGEYVIVVNFGEEMATSGDYSVLDLENYVLTNGTKFFNLSDIDDANVASVNEGKSVEIRLPIENGADNDTDVDFSNSYKLQVARVADADGNVTKNLSSEVNLVAYNPTDKIEIVQARVLGQYTVKLYFSDYIDDFDEDDIVMSYDSKALGIDNVAFGTDDDGNTTATFTIADKYADSDDDFDGITGDFDELDGTTKTLLEITTKATTKSTNSYDVELEATASIAYNNTDEFKDKMAPVIATVGDDDDIQLLDVNKNGKIDHVRVTYEEPVFAGSVSTDKYSVDGYDVEDVYASDNVPTDLNRTGITIANSKTVWVRVDEKDFVDETDTPEVSVKEGVKDVAGNETDAIDDADSLAVVSPVASITISDETNNAAGIDNDDTITVVFDADVVTTDILANAGEATLKNGVLTLGDGTKFTFATAGTNDTTFTATFPTNDHTLVLTADGTVTPANTPSGSITLSDVNINYVTGGSVTGSTVSPGGSF